jgi:protein O-GlcNAc transferase
MTLERFKELFNAAVRLHNAGDLDGAEAIYRQALVEYPNNPDAQHLLGVLTHQRGNHHEAVGLILHAIDQNPGSRDYHANLGLVWMALGRYQRAADAFRAGLRIDPGNSLIMLNLSEALEYAGENAAAAVVCESAIDLCPDDAEAYCRLGANLHILGDLELSIEAYRNALRLNPQYPTAHSNLIYAMEMHEAKQKTIFAELNEWNRANVVPYRHLIKPNPHRPFGGRKLRIGWVSPDFRYHVVARCMLPLFREFNRGEFENFCYYNYPQADQTTYNVRSAVDHWRDIYKLDGKVAAELIQADQIDVLVDLALHTGLNCLTVFALKPAPVQVCYLGYCGSTGLETMDYRISHPYLDPPGSDLSGYSEKTIFLSSSYFCYRPETVTPEVSLLPALTNGFVTFSCLNNASKASPQTVDLWGRILSALTRSRLIIYSPSTRRQQWIQERLQAAGIEADRLEFLQRTPWREYIATYSRVDIALDTLPYNAGISACDALWMGVPIVTLRGERAVGRMCAAILTGIGHPELIARNSDDYVKIASDLASDLPRLTQLRGRLRNNLETSPVMNAGAVAQELQDIFRKICIPQNSPAQAM